MSRKETDETLEASAEEWGSAGVQHYFGVGGTKVDREKAISCFKQALALNAEHASSNYYLGVSYCIGDIVAKDMFLARKHLKRARKAGFQSVFEVRKVSADAVYALMRDQNVLIKNIATQFPSQEPVFFDPNNSWGFLIHQLLDPVHYRPVKSLPRGVDRTKIFNPQTKLWETRVVNPIRGDNKPGAQFTKKTSTSLLPPPGTKMKLFEKNNGIACLFDLTKCLVKEKYIFSRNVASDERWWLGDESRGPVYAEPLSKIKKINEKASGNIEWNEMLAGLSSEAVIGAAVPEDSLKRRLNGIYRHLLQKIMLHVDAPLFLTVNNGGLSDYTRAMQKNDLFCASKMKNDIVVYDFFCLIALLDQDLSCGLNAPYIAVDIFEPIYQNDIPRVVDILMEDPDQIYQKSRYEQQTPIQAAANQNAWDCVIAIASTAKTDEEDAASYGAVLVYAAKNQLTKVAIALVQANASLYYSFDEIENSGLPKGRYFPIHFAIFYNDMSLLSALLQRDTCSNLTHYADTVSPLAFAISQKNAEASILILASDVELKLCADTIRQEIVQNKFDLINLFLKSDLIASSQKESITVILIEHALRALTLNPLFLTVINEIWKQNAIDFIMQHVQSNEIDKRDAVNTEERIAFHELLKLKILSAVMSGNPRFQTLPEEQKNSSGSGSGNSGFFPPINVRSSAFVVNNHPVKPADNRAETRRTFRRR